MARQVLPIVGAAVGFWIGGPAGAQWGWAAGSIVGGLVDPVVNQGPKMGELPVQTSQEGQPIAIIHGTSTCTGFIMDFGPALKTTEITEGEKGAPKTEGEVVYRNYAIGICEGQIAGILRVWENDKLVYDVREGSLMLEASQIWLSNKQGVYYGTEDQLPDTYLQLNVSGIGTTPAYRGIAYMVFGLEDLTETGGAIKQYRWEVAKAIDQSQWAGYSWTVVQDTNWSSLPALAVDESGTVVAAGLGSVSESWASSDLALWVPGSMPNGANKIAAGNGLFVAIDNGTNTTVWVSASGTSWTNNPHSVNSDKDAIAYGNGFFVITAHNLFLGTHKTIIGTGSGAWTEHTIADDISGPIRFGNGLFVTLQPNQVSWSGNGTSWSQAAAPMPTPHDIEWVDELGLWCLVGVNGTNGVATSPDLVTWTQRTTPNNTYQAGAWAPELGIFAIIGNGGAFITSEDLVTWVVPGTLPSGGGSFTDVIWDPVHSKFVGVSAGPPRIVVSDTTPAVMVGQPTTLAAIVADMHDRARIEEADYDVSELVPISVLGMTITGDYTAADVITTLRASYFFDKAEPGDKLYYPLRGKPVVATLTIDDLVDIPDMSRREQVSEVPKKLHLHSLDPIGGYAPVKATNERSSPDVLAVAEATISVPVMLEVDERRQMVNKMHKVMAADAQGEFKITIPDSFARLIPSDNIGLVLRNQVFRLRIDESEWADGILSLTLRLDRQSAYTSVLTGIPLPPPMAPPSTIVGDTTFAIMDIGARQDSEDDLHIIVAGVGVSEGWYGWALQRSLDGGANYATVRNINTAAVIGALMDDVPSASEDYTDTTNTVRVQLYRDTQTIESITETEFLAEGGAFVLEKADGTWEVMQYLDATVDSAGIFSLTTLHRGRLNSGASAHLTGARFVMLDTASHIPMESAWIGQAVTWRAVSLGQSAELGGVETDTYIGRSQIEWEVASLTLARDGSDVITATWAPRHRFGTDDAPVASMHFLGYRVTLDDGILAPVTFDTTTAGFTYDASALGDPLDVTVSAINRYTGAGPETTDTV